MMKFHHLVDESNKTKAYYEDISREKKIFFKTKKAKNMEHVLKILERDKIENPFRLIPSKIMVSGKNEYGQLGGGNSYVQIQELNIPYTFYNAKLSYNYVPNEFFNNIYKFYSISLGFGGKLSEQKTEALNSFGLKLYSKRGYNDFCSVKNIQKYGVWMLDYLNSEPNEHFEIWTPEDKISAQITHKNSKIGVLDFDILLDEKRLKVNLLFFANLIWYDKLLNDIHPYLNNALSKNKEHFLTVSYWAQPEPFFNGDLLFDWFKLSCNQLPKSSQSIFYIIMQKVVKNIADNLNLDEDEVFDIIKEIASESKPKLVTLKPMKLYHDKENGYIYQSFYVSSEYHGSFAKEIENDESGEKQYVHLRKIGQTMDKNKHFNFRIFSNEEIEDYHVGILIDNPSKKVIGEIQVVNEQLVRFVPLYDLPDSIKDIETESPSIYNLEEIDRSDLIALNQYQKSLN